MIPPDGTRAAAASGQGASAASARDTSAAHRGEPPPGRRLAGVPFPLLLAGLTATYFIAGKLGLALAFLNASASPVWAPTGLAIAAALLLGLRVWPAIFVGAFLVNVTTAGTLATSLGIAFGNTLEAVAGAWLVRTFAGGADAFQRPWTIFRYALLAGGLSTALSATIGVTTLWSAGFVRPENVPLVWLTWWLGDAIGALVVAPLILVWATPREARPPAGGLLEMLGLAAVLAATGWVVFGHRVPNAYICLAPLIWAALRFGRRGAMTASVVMCGIALWGSLHGFGPFIRPSPNETLLFVQAFVGVITLTAVILAAAVRQRERAEGELRRAHEELEDLVGERTASLQEAVEALERSGSALAEAQRVAHVGSWEWDVAANRVAWSAELYRIYGLEPASGPIDYEAFLARVHPADREQADRIVRASFETGEPFAFEHRIVRPDGDVRILQARGYVVRREGRTTRMLGTGQDITDQKRAQAAVLEAEERFRHLAEHASDVISFSRPGEAVHYVSPAVREVLGYEPEVVSGRRFADLAHPDDRALVLAHMDELGGDRDSVTTTFRARHKDGHYVWVESVANVRRDPTGDVDNVVTITRDVTATVERARFRELLQSVTAAANQAATAEDALSAALEVICRFREWPLGHVYLRADDGTDDLVPTGIWYPREPHGHEEFRKVTEATRFESGVGLPGRVLASGKAAWIPDVARDPNFPRARQVQTLGLAAAFGFPVRAGDDVLAVLEFFTTEVLAPEQRFLDTLEQVGAQLGQVLRRQRAEGTLRRSEAALAQAQAIAHVGSWEWDVARSRLTWSDELFRIHGREPGGTDLTYDDFLTHVHPADRGRIERAVRDALEACGAFEYEYRLVRPDGAVRVVFTTGFVEAGPHGEAARMYGVCQDVTERREAESALKESERRYRFLADYATDMITMLTPDGVCTYASPAARVLLEYAPEELVGMPVADLLHPEDVDAVTEARHAILKSTASQAVVCRLRRRSGRWIWAETTSRGVRDPATGLVVSVVAVTRNVTDRVRAQETMHLLQRVSSIANESTTLETAMKDALEAIGRYAGWPIGHVYVPSRDGGRHLTPSDIWYLEDPRRFSEFRKLSEMTPIAIGEGLPGAVLESGRAKWIPDITTVEPPFLRRSAADALGLRAAFAFPVTVMGECMAVLEFFSTEAREADEDLLELMQTVGEQLGQVVRRERAETGLRASEVRFRAVAETANDGIITMDDEGTIVYCNEAAKRIFDRDDLVGKPIETVIPERFRAAHRAGLSRYLETGESRILGTTVELDGLRRGGAEVPIELSLSDWRTEGGLFFTGIVRDITPRKQAEAALNEKMEELARSNAELGLFSYVASHDLREPLRTVASNVQLLEREMESRLTGPAKKSLRFALDGVYRMQELIEDLLAYSRVGTEGREFQPVETEAVVAEVLSGLAATMESENAQVTRDPLPTVWGDRSQIAQIFQNLLSNAFKFHDERPPRVHLSAERNGTQWRFTVRDEGIGFDPDFAEHVFTIFQRLHPPEEFPGTGIGLSICRKIVERHGGRIWAETDPGQGTAFHFTLPALDQKSSR